MRNNPPLKKGSIHAKEARIFWDCDTGKVTVLGDGQSMNEEIYAMPFSGGACYSKWRECCQNADYAKILCLRQFWDLVYIYEMDPVVVDEALADIVEYQEAFISLPVQPV